MNLAAWLERGRTASRSAPLAIALLVAANLVPLFGVIWLGWSVALVLIAYWLENGIVGLLNVPKIVLARGPSEVPGPPGPLRRGYEAGFFLLHYGIFWIVHGVFVFVLTGSAVTSVTDPLGAALADPAVLVVALGLLISHGASFVLNFIGRRGYLAISPDRQMYKPYPRMVVLHATIVVGGAAVQGAGQPVLLVALLVVGKTVFDLLLHLREHGRRGQVGSLTPRLEAGR